MQIESLRGSSSSLATAVRLEKHIDDVRKGRGYLSREVAIEVSERAAAADDYLSKTNPEAFSRYSAYGTILAYDRKARYLNAISKVVEFLQQLNEAGAAKGISISA